MKHDINSPAMPVPSTYFQTGLYVILLLIKKQPNTDDFRKYQMGWINFIAFGQQV